jgi:type I restriction enzyme S subunit
MKQNWEYCQLEDAVTKGSSNISLNKIKDEDGDYPVFAAKGFVQNVSFFQQEKRYLAIIKDGAGIGRVSKHPAKSSVVATMQYLIPKKDFDIDFIKYFLEGIDFENHRSGSTIPHIYFKDYKSEKFPKIPLSEQQRIVSILDKAFAAIDKAKANAEQNLQNAKELFESYLLRVFENKGDGWEETTLEKEIDLLTGFAFKSKHYTNLSDDILLVRGDNIMQGYFRWDDAKRWNRDEFSEYNRFQLFENDVVLAMDRPWVKAGLKCAMISKNEIPSLLVQRTASLRCKLELDSSFLFYLVKSASFTNHLLGVQTGIGVPHISGKQILAYNFFKPSSKEQQTIVRQLDALRAETHKLEAVYQKKMDDLEELKKSILQKAFAGELEIEKAVAV